MAKYPNEIYEPREKENRAGVVYDPNKKTVIFVEDIKALDDEVVAIEKLIGKNAAGQTIPVKGALLRGLAGEQSKWSTEIFIDDNGNVGIGTTEPSEKLEVVQQSGGGSAVLLVKPRDQTNASAILRLQTNNAVGSGASNSHADLQFYDGTTLGFRFLAAFGNSPAFRYGGFIAYTDRDGNKLPLRFITTDADGNTQTALFIQAGQSAGTSGNVGIGTTAPTQKLEVNGAIRFFPMSAPSNPTEGAVYYDSTAKKLKVYNGTTWETIQSS
jgi:hypothetical protein